MSTYSRFFRRQLLFAAVLLAMVSCLPLFGQSKIEQARAKVDSVLDKRYHKVSYDTAYIGRPDARLTLKVRANISGNSSHARGTLDNEKVKADFNTDNRATLSFNANYKGLSAGISLNPASLSGRSKDYQFNIRINNTRFTLEAGYQMSKTLRGNIKVGDFNQKIERGWLNSEVVDIVGYYIFNHRRFSYPAAFTQSYLQKRSAGSWLAGLSYEGGSMKTAKDAPADIPKTRTYIGHFGVGGRYAYNLVLGKKWLLHFSTLPTFIVFNFSNITVDGEREKLHTRFPNMLWDNRLAVVHNISEKYFVGATLVMNNTFFNNNDVDFYQNKWLTRFFFGVRL